MLALVTATILAATSASAEDVIIDRDDVVITSDAILHIDGSAPIADANGNGVIHITGDDITVRFADDALLRGAPAGHAPDQMTGVGIVITGKNVTLLGARVSGYHIGVHAKQADGLTIRSARFDDNFRQRLGSTPAREDTADWLWPHENDNNEWTTRYGASLWIEDSDDATVSNVAVRNGQNGIVLDQVNNSRVFDCDCSFLSGWGIAMWRSSDNIICRNALDFCIRGYSHGVYNRGQDSAGLLMFEQCNNNLIAENSITHGGDGVFMFAGREALGEKNPREDLDWYKGRGCSGNTFYRNDLSYAAAHGLECTFSFDNIIVDNRIVENAICGIWGGYSQRTIIIDNAFASNGDRGYGLERGGINIEHGIANHISANTFDADKCGIHLWWDDDGHLFKTPWYKANHPSDAAPAATVRRNVFSNMPLAIHLRDVRRPVELGASELLVADEELKVEGDAAQLISPAEKHAPELPPMPESMPGLNRPVQARPELQGRHNIIMTEWGPWDHQSPLARRTDDRAKPGEHVWTLHGFPKDVAITHDDAITATLEHVRGSDPILRVTAAGGSAQPYAITVKSGDVEATIRGVLIDTTWHVTCFTWTTDPREDVEQWRSESKGAKTLQVAVLDLPYASGGPANVLSNVDDAIGSDRFGTLGTTTVTLPAGKWRLRTTSDDGIRVWLADEVVIDDWTWHAPKEHVHTFTLTEPTRIPMRVEHFELDGYAVLSVEIEHVNN